MAHSMSDGTMPLFERTVHRRIWDQVPADRRRRAMTLLADLIRQYAQQSKAGSEPGSGGALLLHPPFAHGQLTLCGHQPGGQRCPGLEEHADETQEVPEQLPEAFKTVPKVPEDVEDGTHAALITEMTMNGNLP